jgi:hypothetical protein
MSDMASKPKSRRRSQRANVSERIRGVYLHAPTLSEQPVRVLNVSEHGVGLPAHSLENLPEPGTEIQGEIRIGSGRSEVTMCLVYANPAMMGFSFVEPSEVLQGAIRTFFDTEIAGAHFRLSKHEVKDGEEKFSFRGLTHHSLDVGTDEGNHKNVRWFKLKAIGVELNYDRSKEEVQATQNERPSELNTHQRNQLRALLKNLDELPDEIRTVIDLLVLNADLSKVSL